MSDAQFEEAAELESEGNRLRAAGDIAGAIERYTRMRDLLAERATALPDDRLAMQHVATATLRLSGARSDIGDYRAALRLAKDALRICEPYCEADPTDSEPERYLNLCCDLVGDVLRNMGQAEDSIPYLKRGVELARWLASLPFGDEGRKLNDLAGSLQSFAWALERADRLEDALETQEEQVSLVRTLVAMDTGCRKRRKFLGLSLSSMGSILRKLDRVEEARDVLDQALAEYQRTFHGVDQGPFDVQHRVDARREAGKAAARGGDLGAAMRHLEIAVELGRDVAASAPDSRSCQWTLRSALTELSSVFRKEGDERAARSAASEAAELEARLSDP